MRTKGFEYGRYINFLQKVNKTRIKDGKSVLLPYSEQVAREVYYNTRNDLIDDKNKGLRGSIGNVYQYMAREQGAIMGFNVSFERARALYKYAKSTNQNLKFKDIRYMNETEVEHKIDWEYINEEYKLLKEKGWLSKDIQKYVAFNYFGSE